MRQNKFIPGVSENGIEKLYWYWKIALKHWKVELLGNCISNIGKWHLDPENYNFKYMKHWKMELETLENGIGNQKMITLNI